MAGGKAKIGLIGLGTMGANLALNIADSGHRVAVFNRTTERMHAFVHDAGDLADNIAGCETLDAFVDAIEEPRSIILMVPAGEVVDKQIAALKPHLDDDDLILDAGNANFHDTRRRVDDAKEEGRPYLGVGVSGGSEGARHGPSIMVGGDADAWARVRPILEDIAATHDGAPCADYFGPDGAGHFVKTVHNGIEYADMQMIAEVYGLMRDALGLSSAQIAEHFEQWNDGQLQSYLVEITAKVAAATDDKTGQPMLDVILDRAGQKGTGRWTAVEALHLGAPVTTIDAAVAARNLSSRLGERKTGEDVFGAAPQEIAPADLPIGLLESALLAGKIACYAQGFGLLNAASAEFTWDIPLPRVAKVWRAGCIIRSAMLDDMAEALPNAPHDNLMYAPHFAEILTARHDALRAVVAHAALAGSPAPALCAALSYFDTMRTARGTANMIQAQRDFFGAHSFERRGEDGSFHGPWRDS